jgi:MFS family permease
MFERLDRTRSLTANQMRIVVAAILGDMLEFFDYFLIGFVLAFIVVPWKLSFGQSAIILLSSGIGAILGAAIWGRLADRIGRRAVFIGTVLNFSIATGILALTPDEGWIFLSVSLFRRVRRRWALLRRSSVSSGICPGVTAGLYRRLGHRVYTDRGHDWLGSRRLSDAGDRLAGAVRLRAGAGVVGPVNPCLGPGIAALASADGPARGSAALACLGAEGAPGIFATAAN